MSDRRFSRHRYVAAAVAIVAALAFAAPASAGVLVANAPSCDPGTLSQVFLPWADLANYELAPGGTVENGTSGWTLSGSASVVSGNESYKVNSDEDSSSLLLRDPSTAITDELCVGLDHPTMRFFVRRASGSPLASLRVDVAWEDVTGHDWWSTIGTIGAVSQWAPSPQMVITPALLPLLPGLMTPVQFRFVPQGGDFQVDDVYVDPFGGH